MLKRAWDDKIIFGWVVFILLPLLALEIFYGTKMSGSLEKLAAEQATHVVGSLAEVAQVSFQQEIQKVSLLAYDDGAGGWGSSKQRQEIIGARFAHVMEVGRDRYEALFLADPGGVILVARPEAAYRGTNVGRTDYFLEAMAGKKTIGRPYRSDQLQQWAAVVAVPLYAKTGKFLGVVGAVLNMEPLLDRISSVRVGASGYSFVVDQSGFVLAHSDKGHVPDLRVNRMPGMENIAPRMLAQQDGSETFSTDGVKKLAVFAPVKLTGWSLCLVQETDDMIVLPRSTRNGIFLTGGIFLIVAVFAALYLPKKKTKPAESEGEPITEPVTEPITIEWPVAPGPAPIPQSRLSEDRSSGESAAAGDTAETAMESNSERTYAAHVAARGAGDYDRVSTFIKRPLEQQTHYEVLELGPHATPFEIRQAYKTAIQLYQASSMASYSFFSEEERGRILARLEEVYLTLIHDEKRAEYDQMLIERGDMDEGQQYRKTYKKPVPIIDLKDQRTQGSPLSERVKSKKAASPVVGAILGKETLTGEDLRRIRTELDVSLKEIADVTRVRIGLLHAIEEDQVGQISSRLHLESFVKSYASCLQLDAELVARRYMKRLKE